MVKDLEKMPIVIGALDECAKSEKRKELLVLIIEIYAWSLSKMHLVGGFYADKEV
jgi:hypothetical protein